MFLDITCFPPWESAVHTSPEQVKRMINGSKIQSTEMSINHSRYSGIFIGSGVDAYSVNLFGCDCMDFSKRHKPCKHMYRLAMECGLIAPFPVGSREGIKAAKEMAAADVEKWQKEFEAGNISPDKYVKIADALMSK